MESQVLHPFPHTILPLRLLKENALAPAWRYSLCVVPWRLVVMVVSHTGSHTLVAPEKALGRVWRHLWAEVDLFVCTLTWVL